MDLISKTLEVKKYIPKTDPYDVEKRRRTRNEPETTVSVSNSQKYTKNNGISV